METLFCSDAVTYGVTEFESAYCLHRSPLGSFCAMGKFILYVTALMFVLLAGDLSSMGPAAVSARTSGARSLLMLTSLPIMPPLMPMYPTNRISPNQQGFASVDISATAQCLRGGAAGALLNRIYHRLLCLNDPVPTSTTSGTFRPLSDAFWEGLVPLLERELQEFARVDSNTPVLVSGGSCRCTAPNFLNSVTILRRVPATRSYLFDQLP